MYINASIPYETAVSFPAWPTTNLFIIIYIRAFLHLNIDI
jgi:hypothetical protein